MKVGDLVRLKGDDIRGTAAAWTYIIPAGTIGIVVLSPEAEHHPVRPFVKLCGHREPRPFLSLDLEVINESR